MHTIHLITPTVTKGRRDLDEIAHLATPTLRFTHSNLDRGPPSVECELDEALAAPDTIRRAIEAERDGADAIVIDCMGDPALKAAREAVRVPVLGPAETSMHLAAMLGQKFSVVTVVDTVKPMIANLARVYGVYEKLASIRVVNIPVLEIRNDFEETKRRLSAAAIEAVERDGADVIILGCTGFLGCAAAIEADLRGVGHDVPVIDPIPATVCAAEAIVKAGLRHSKRTYATPPFKTFVGYDISLAPRDH